MELVNYTGHDINTNNNTVYPNVGIARVKATFGEFDSDLICDQNFGEIENLPEPKEGVTYIVSGLVLLAAKAAGRTDVVAPATGHPDCQRSDDRKVILSVPGFVK